METFKIIKAIVVVGLGTDRISLTTNLPDPLWPYTGLLCLNFQAPPGLGEQYVHDHFGLLVEVVNARPDANSTGDK